MLTCFDDLLTRFDGLQSARPMAPQPRSEPTFLLEKHIASVFGLWTLLERANRSNRSRLQSKTRMVCIETNCCSVILQVFNRNFLKYVNTTAFNCVNGWVYSSLLLNFFDFRTLAICFELIHKSVKKYLASIWKRSWRRFDTMLYQLIYRIYSLISRIHR